MNLIMTHLSKLRSYSTLKWGFVNLAKNNFTQNPRFYGSNPIAQSKNGQKSKDLTQENISLILPHREAQDALIEYLHSTRSLQYSDAENISRNSPEFLEKLLKNVENEKDAKQSLRRLLCYHPINEFEPFFESMGLKRNEYSLYLPRNMMYLTDDQRLLENYHVLCEYGIAPNKIGKIFIDANEVFRYDCGRLLSQLNSLQAKGFSQSSVIKLVTFSPNLLVNENFFKVLEVLMNVGIGSNWFDEHILEENSYNWSKIIDVLWLLKKFGIRNEDLRALLTRNPAVLLEDSGATTLSLVVFLIKFGASVENISSTFIQFPEIKIQTFLSNLKNGYLFLNKIEMDADDITYIIRTHSSVLGSCTLKTVKTLLNGLNCGKKRLCEIIKENPQELKKWGLGTRVTALPKANTANSDKRIQFLSNLGFIENSKEMSKALKVFRGNGGELQERFDCLVNSGLSRKNVAEMVKTAPQIINQSKEVIEMKIDLLVNGLGYNVSSLVQYPGFLGYSVQKIKLRFAMYKWLVDRRLINGKLALSTVLACSDKIFIRDQVNRVPEGLIVWDKFKTQFLNEIKFLDYQV